MYSANVNDKKMLIADWLGTSGEYWLNLKTQIDRHSIPDIILDEMSEPTAEVFVSDSEDESYDDWDR